ncbi:MAG: SGNH/GDSL hydrolase family protein [Lachnospiraceae bacterium]
MKKITAYLLIMAMILSSLTACGKDENNEGSNPATAPTQAAGENGQDGNQTQEGDITYTISDKVIADSYPAIPTVDVDVTDEMCEEAIVSEGNLQRLASVMAKASAGEDITIAYIGGSITDGSVASPQEKNCYAGLTQVWWEYTFQDATINYVNAGVGATDSYIGVHRVADDVLSQKPDLVVVEFSVNDYRSMNKETYESLLRKILLSETEPAVVSLVLCTENSYYQDHYAVASNLQVPIVSYAKVAQENMENGTWQWSQLGSSDKTHPNNGGHSVIAHLLTYFYNKVLYSINDSRYVEYEVPEKLLTLSRYENADILYSDKIDAATMDGFEKTTIYSNLFDNNGWKTTSGGTITFELENVDNVGVIFWRTTDGKSGQFDVYVNGECVTTIDGHFENGWGNYAEYIEIGKYPDNEGLTITIQPAEGSTGEELSILALTVS